VKTKTYPASFKAGPELIAGEDKADFEAIVSVFNNVDRGGDIVRPGAFTDTIAAWKASGDTLPVLWSHNMADPMFNIGAVKEIEELSPGDARIPEWANPWVKDNGGLWVRAEIDTHAEASPIAKQVRWLLKSRRVTQFSFAYEVLDSAPGYEDGTTELLKLWLYEVGPTPIGMNGLTELVGAKSRPPDEAAGGAPPGENADPPGTDDPTEDPSITTKERGPSAALLRIRCEIDALITNHAS